MKCVSTLLLTLSLLHLSAAEGQERPPRDYENWGVCPFECCTYREWQADADIPVHQERSEHSAIVFRLHRDEKVDALTGVVVTNRPAEVHIDRPVKNGYAKDGAGPALSLNAGDVVYMLSPLGEGAYLFWYRGKIYTSGTDLAAMPGVDGKDAQFTWWKLVKNKHGKKGWTTSEKFKGADACG